LDFGRLDFVLRHALVLEILILVEIYSGQRGHSRYLPEEGSQRAALNGGRAPESGFEMDGDRPTGERRPAHSHDRPDLAHGNREITTGMISNQAHGGRGKSRQQTRISRARAWERRPGPPGTTADRSAPLRSANERARRPLWGP